MRDAFGKTKVKGTVLFHSLEACILVQTKVPEYPVRLQISCKLSSFAMNVHMQDSDFWICPMFTESIFIGSKHFKDSK